MMKNDTPKPLSFDILGVHVDSVSQQDLHAEIKRLIDSGQKKLILNVNVHCLNLAFENRWLRKFLNSAHLVFCDGYGVVLAAAILGHRAVERITFADWMQPLSAFAGQNGYSFFFLGAKPGIAERAAARLLENFPSLRIVGTHHGYFDKNPASPENRSVLEQINAARPNILLVCFGMPLQERWLMENWGSLDANIALTGGAVLDYTAGTLKRSPRWMTAHALEWLGRVFIEPGRLWKRYLFGIPVFLWRVFLGRFGMLRVDD
jgi:N-acetylglucosaminyldiphosphoundecaprenol N-acetyl-beta-D-mannosaminyltransferase